MTDATSAGTARRPAARGRLGKVVWRRVSGALLILLTVLYISPFLIAFATSIRPSADVAKNPVAWPTSFDWSSWKQAYEVMHYGQSVLNTVILVAGTALLTVVTSALAGYALGRVARGWSTTIYRLFLLGTTFPVFVILAPLYLQMRDLHLLGTRVGVMIIFTGLYLPIGILFYTSFVRKLPVELEEAASIDGCGPIQTFFRIVLPLLKPVTATMLVLMTLHVWNDLIIPLLFLPDPEKRTVVVNAYAFVDPKNIDPTTLFAAALLGTLPLLIAFAFLQRQVVEGLGSGAVKG